MANAYQAIRGMNDILPEDSARWQTLHKVLTEVCAAYGYSEIRLPIVERTELFARSIGEVTDIVEKEMYTFEDRGGDSLSLRPEGTAGCVRAAIQHGLLHNQVQRLWYGGPMFRYERPQKGRYRQFHQYGVEAFGLTGPDIDVELLLMSARLWKRLGVSGLKLQINSLGTSESRAAYRELLVEYFQGHHGQLDEDSQRRLQSNPLRILDSKNPDIAEIIAKAPSLLDHLDDESAEHFDAVCAGLKAAGVKYTVNPRIVRGLDYYSRTVFEWTTDQLGAQDAVCSGGRYDDLVTQLGGKPTPAIGFALGVERLIALMEMQEAPLLDNQPQVYIAHLGEAAALPAQQLAEQLRDALPDLRMVLHAGGGSFKSQMKKADRSGAALALIIGEEEAKRSCVQLKPLRSAAEQREIQQDEAVTVLAQELSLQPPVQI
ncbi:MAG: histidine--tRNA ligase [Salinisphaeraceae bacterium]|nr:histidine--tRNA ligase [Salinisphaeraceae bacterium]